MKLKVTARKHNVWSKVLYWLKLKIKIFRKKLSHKSLKKKSVKSFPNEAPH